MGLLRKYDCTRVQVVPPQAQTGGPGGPVRFSAGGERANLPVDSAKFLVCPILEIPGRC
jgi:hypothetical protein